ncbi:MAG: hypothetical protein CMF46_02715 [Legionellales bacterium]|nr:hypothetical protein [Legionellales bacterium]|tara:strand:- start:128 stop:469 length:342 start_codon:yes stop_codon:yes gene_type:complete
MSYLIICLVLLILLSLATGLYHLIFSGDEPEKLVKSLAIRICLSLCLFLVLLATPIISQMTFEAVHIMAACLFALLAVVCIVGYYQPNYAFYLSIGYLAALSISVVTIGYRIT